MRPFFEEKGITVPILVLGFTPVEYVHIAARFNISLTVYQKEWLIEAAEVLQGECINVHVKVDTGMGRIGVRNPLEFTELVDLVRKNPCFYFEGVYTHFAKADELDSSYYIEQLERFHSLLQKLEEKPKWIHASNSAATLMHKESFFDFVRCGISIYGLTPSVEIKGELPIQLQPALSLHTRLTHIKKVEAGAKISYGCTYAAQKDEWIGTIPIGYADGWIRALQGQEVLIDGIRVPIVGRICMDQCMIKLPKYYPVGTKVTLIGKQGDEEISADEIAEKLNTINYEVVCLISARVPRVYKVKDTITKVTNPLLAIANEFYDK